MSESTKAAASAQSEKKGSAALVRSVSGAVTGFRHSIPVSTTENVAGREIESVIGLVRGNSIRSRHLGRDIMAGLKSLVGGEIVSYTAMLAQSREQALDRMIEQAVSEGANAVVAVRITTSTVMSGAAEILAYGTAVVLGEASSEA